jgi:hypothetical protein
MLKNTTLKQIQECVKEEVSSGFARHQGTCPYGRKVDIMWWAWGAGLVVFGLILTALALK